MRDHFRIDELRERLDDISSRFESIAFGFLDPWTVHSGLVRDVMSYLEKRDFIILSYRYKKLRPEDVEHIYRKNHPIKESTSWHIPGEVYSMGLSFGFLVGSDRKRDLYRELLDLKGKSEPLLGQPGTLRFDFRAPNKSLSLVHISDDPLSSVFEALPFFGLRDMEQSVVSLNGILSGGTLGVTIPDHAWVPSEHVSELLPTRLLAKLHARACQLSTDWGGSSCVREFWERYLREVNFAGIGVSEEINIYLSHVEQARRIIDRTPFTPLVKEDSWKRWYVSIPQTDAYALATRILHSYEVYSVLDTSWFVSKFDEIFADRWEILLFKTTLFHFDELRSAPERKESGGG